MARRSTDLLKVVVLPRHAETALIVNGARIRACLGAAKELLELHHSRVGEEERGVASGEERGARHFGVSAGREEGDKARAKLSGAT